MAQPTEPHHGSIDNALDHLEDEVKALEGVTRWGPWLRWSALVLVLAGIIAAVVWMVASPPPTTSARMSYIPSAAEPIEVSEPRGVALKEPPARFAWESVTGRLQYVVRVYVKGTSVPVVERVVTTPSLELTPEERARIPHGETYVWTVIAQGKDGATIGAGEATFKVR